MEIKKILAISIILLFLGVAVAPSINVSIVKASIDDDLVEVTTQACGIQGYGDTTVKLTREQYQNLEEYLVEFRARLNQTSTREEAVPIFKDAVVELDKYGLLPKGISVERAQKLITGKFQNDGVTIISKMSSFKNQQKTGINYNALCLIAGRTNYTLPTNRVANGLTYSGELLFEYGLGIGLTLYQKYPNLMLFLLPFWFLTSLVLIGLGIIIQETVNLIPFSIVNLIGIGAKSGSNVLSDFGWVHTNGILGLKNWEGKLVGTLPGYVILDGPPLLFFPAIWGFSGIKIWLDSENWWENTYFGTAIFVGLNEIQ